MIHHKSKSKVTQRTKKSNSVNLIQLLFFCRRWYGRPQVDPWSLWPNPCFLPSGWLFDLSATRFLQSSLSSFAKSRLRITLLKLALSFNLLLLSKTMFLVSKLSNFINKGLGFEDSSTFLPPLNISKISFSIFLLITSLRCFYTSSFSFDFPASFVKFYTVMLFCLLCLIVDFNFWVCVGHRSLDFLSICNQGFNLIFKINCTINCLVYCLFSSNFFL